MRMLNHFYFNTDKGEQFKVSKEYVMDLTDIQLGNYYSVISTQQVSGMQTLYANDVMDFIPLYIDSDELYKKCKRLYIFRDERSNMFSLAKNEQNNIVKSGVTLKEIMELFQDFVEQ